MLGGILPLIDLFQVELVVNVGLTLVTYVARGAQTHHLPICRQTRYTPDYTATRDQALKYDYIEIPWGSRGMQIVYS